MRAPPRPRRSKSNVLPLLYARLKDKCHFNHIKRRWNLHKLHKLQFKEINNNTLTPLTGARVEDMFNVPTNILPSSAKHKPLLIASFPEGCSKSPKIEVLQRSKWARLFLTRKKYKLKYMDNHFVKEYIKTQPSVPEYDCLLNVNTIKRVTKKNADVRVIYHNKNTIKLINIGQNKNNKFSFIDFDNCNSLRISDFTFSKRQTNSSQSKAERTKIIPRKQVVKLTLFHSGKILSHSNLT